MVEVFRTNVHDQVLANKLVGYIHSAFRHYSANFDLDDCDKILRVACSSGAVHAPSLIDFLKNHGSHAEILPDDADSFTQE